MGAHVLPRAAPVVSLLFIPQSRERYWQLKFLIPAAAGLAVSSQALMSSGHLNRWLSERCFAVLQIPLDSSPGDLTFWT